MSRKLKIVHIISGLGQGGAEAVLYRLVTHDQKSQHIVISLGDAGVYGAPLEQAGIQVICLSSMGRFIGLKAYYRLCKVLKSLSPDIVQTWMYHANFIGGLAAKTVGVTHIVWGIRNSGLGLKEVSKSSYYSARIGAFLSHWIPQKIIVCAQYAFQPHVDMGYDTHKMVVIPNGYDMSKWHPQPSLRNIKRGELGLQEGDFVIAFVARWNAFKDHQNLIDAFTLVLEQQTELHLVLVGKDMDQNNQILMHFLTARGIVSRVHLLGMRQDISELMNAFDLHVLSSKSEGFPNVVAESMACGIPNVVTNVGDAAVIVADKGWIVPSQNSEALAKAILEAKAFIKTANQQWYKDLRQSVVNRFSIETMCQHYEQVWHQVIGD